MKYLFSVTLCFLLNIGNSQKVEKTNRIMLPLLDNSQTIKKIERGQINESASVTNWQMDKPWYEKSFTDTTVQYKNLNPGFIILVDKNLKAKNFISDYEAYLRKQSVKPDTSAYSIMYSFNWEKLSVSEKVIFVNQKKLEFKHNADSIHAQNNQGKNLVWLINNTEENVSTQMQDWSYICILQALNKEGKWQPIQYWRFSGCGNSYHDKQFAPKTANSFVTSLPNKGDFETRFRFKLLGATKFYYSNEFEGKMNYCEFLENSKIKE